MKRPSTIRAVDNGDDLRPLGEVLDFLRRIWALDHALQSRSKRMRSAIGLTGPQRLVLRVLGRNPGISAGRLATVLHLHPSTLTGILQRMVVRGLVARTSDPRDGRRAILALTAKGKALDVVSKGSIESIIEKTLRRLSPVGVSAAEGVFEALTNALQEDADNPATRIVRRISKRP